MIPGRQVVVHEDAAKLAEATADRFADAILVALADRGRANVVLTGGGVGIATLASLAASQAREAIDWARVDVWWGDERFLPGGDPDRNETQARAALLDRLDAPAGRVHAMPAMDAGPWDDDPAAAASWYSQELAAAGQPEFDVVLLGVGPDGHVASLFPDHPDQRSDAGVTVVPVRRSPKPPPTRVSLTFEAICRARQVWLLAAGAEKAAAVGRAVTVDDRVAVPASGVTGTQATLWLVDRAAAAEIPEEILGRRAGAG